jgi:hypothetical protein
MMKIRIDGRAGMLQDSFLPVQEWLLAWRISTSDNFNMTACPPPEVQIVDKAIFREPKIKPLLRHPNLLPYKTYNNRLDLYSAKVPIVSIF